MARRTLSALAAILMAALGTGDLWATVTVFDNYGPSWGYNTSAGTFTIGGSQKFKQAMAFMPSQSGTLTELWMTTGWNTSAGSFNVWLASDNSGIPGATLESWSAQSQGILWGAPDPTPPLHLTSVADPSLAAGQQYWLCASSDVTTRSDGWYRTPTTQEGLYAYASLGGAWTTPVTYPLGAFRVNAEAPEPATLALLGLGAAGLVTRRMRRK